MKTETIELLAGAGSKTSIAGAAVGGIGAFLASNFIGIAGVVVALLGVLINMHYRRKADKRHAADAALKTQERMLRMEIMRNTGIVLPTTDLGELGADE